MRRLPPWMLAGKSVDGKRKHEPEAFKSKVEKRPRRTIKPQETEEPKKVEIRTRGGGEQVSNKHKEEEAKPSIDNVITQSVTGSEDEDLTVDDLLSFAQEYVKDQTRKERGSLSTYEPMVDVYESNMTSSQSQGRGTSDPTSEEMINLLLGPFFSKQGQ